ncbi:hypothetical protein BH23VER1_BH23VER1_22200 [soil metagenome]
MSRTPSLAPAVLALALAACAHPSPSSTRPVPHGFPALHLERKSDDGRYLVTSDGAAWLVAPRAQPTARLWGRRSPILANPYLGDPRYPFRLIHLPSGSSVPAQRGLDLY